MHSEKFYKEFFSDLATIKLSTSFHCNIFTGRKSYKCFRCTKLVLDNVHDSFNNFVFLSEDLLTKSFSSKNVNDNIV